MPVLLPKPRGDLSDVLFEAMRTEPTEWERLHSVTPDSSDDAQICLWALYELHYRGFEDVDDELEWHPELLCVRRALEEDFERSLRDRCEIPDAPEPSDEAQFAATLLEFIEGYDGRSLATFVQRQADADQVLDLLRMRSIYHLKESDPTAWVVPRLGVTTQAALMELQYDEYGAGDPNRHHSHLFARGMEACGLNSAYGAYIDEAPTEVLDQNNAMSLFGLHRRLRGAALGHLAAFEATSSQPCRRMSQGLERLGLPPEIIAYYNEHVEADAVHEQLAIRTICASLVAAEAALADDVFFGAYTCLDLETRFADSVLAESDAA